MNRSKEQVLSNTERDFILEAIRGKKRLDGRETYDHRNIAIELGNQLGHVIVTLGNTRVQACVYAEVTQPKPNRPAEGQLYFNVTLSPMGSPAFEVATKSASVAVETTRILERCFKESRSVDMESLCIIAGQKVWSIRVDIHILNHCGNILDTSALAAITALKYFRRPDVTVTGETATIHPVSEREPVPLSIHHIPVCITFAFYDEGEHLLVDPSLEEELVMEGKLIISMNTHQELCTLQLAGGVALLPDQVFRCVEVVKTKVHEIVDMVKQTLDPSGNSNTAEMSEATVLETERGEETALMEMDEEKTIAIAQDNDNDNDPTGNIVPLGENTVQLNNNNHQIQRLSTSTSDSNGIEELMSTPTVNKVPPKGGVDSSEEEEHTVVISAMDIGGFDSKGNQSYDSNKSKKPKTSRRKKKKQ